MKTPKLGQHFLTDETVIDRIVEAARLSKDDVVLEVGPGKGILTRALLQSGAHVVAVEKDSELHHNLKKQFKDFANFELILGDIREFDLRKLPSGYKVAANIPYYLTGQLIQMLLTSENPPSLSVLMIQDEVAERLAAPKGESSILQLTSQVFAEPKKEFFVPRGAFNPPPKVDSAVISLKAHAKPLVAAGDQRNFFRLVKTGFAGKRKKLTNTLVSGLHLEKDLVLNALKACGLSENARPQELDLKEWINLYKELQKF